ncbi:Ribosomal RNA small subunit methyltransferase B [Oligella sp. MSHR50489EDL]|uniref:RsmB/NOP family class I SAM-dependent RNA methyltransferase n=1 Tax=Oligella sp. MSHR50489EDL TaxID=3139409 RepID=UPI003D819384
MVDRRKKTGAARDSRSVRATKNGTAAFKKVRSPADYANARLQQLQRVLTEVLKFKHPADAVLSHWFRDNRSLGLRDRGEIAETVFEILRHLRRYRHFAQSGEGSEYRRLALLGLTATKGEDYIAELLTPFEAEWLAHVKALPLDSMPWEVRHSLPDWLAERIRALPAADSLVEALNTKAPLDLRVNPLKIQREEALKQMQAEPYAAAEPVATPYSPWGIRLANKPAINLWPLFKDGSLEVQDEGSQILCALVGPRRSDMVIDFCAGAGGKTLLLGAMMRSAGRLYAFDVSEARLARARPRLSRSGLSNVTPVVIANENDARVKRLAAKAERVLVDAPCSGFGTLRRNPDMKWRQSPEALAEIKDLQQSILQSAARCVAPGGRLVYSTCSILPEENEQQVQQFLANHPDFSLMNAVATLGGRVKGLSSEDYFLRLRPDVHGTDGFFVAVLERRTA